CVGRSDIMDAAWPPSTGEAIHTSTFLGHPVGCAMALAQIREIEARKLVERSERLGKFLLRELSAFRPPRSVLFTCRGRGLLAGNQLRRIVAAAELTGTDRVLEIGPGLGPLTELLLAQAGEVLALEKDRRLNEILQKRFAGADRLTLRQDDALEFLRGEPRD